MCFTALTNWLSQLSCMLYATVCAYMRRIISMPLAINHKRIHSNFFPIFCEIKLTRKASG